MPPTTIAELYVEELKDLYSAEQQILKALPKMIKAASHASLKDAFEAHRRQTETHVQRLQQIVDDLGGNPKGKKCHGMEGIIAEGAEMIEQVDKSALLDAGLIAAAQHVEHYEMAGYGSVRTWAEQLGHGAHVKLLQETLNEEKETDRLLTQLAEQSINLEAESEIELSDESADTSPRSKPARRPASSERPQTRRPV